MSYRLVNANEIATKYPEVNEMDCIYVDLPNGLDNEYHHIDAEPITLDEVIAAHERIAYNQGRRDGYAEAVEAKKHGTWITVVRSYNHITYYCPKCGSIFDKGCADLGEYNYCPNCGARMIDEVTE